MNTSATMYDILVITKSGESRKDYEVQDLIGNRCFYRTPVTVITHDVDFVNKMLSEVQTPMKLTTSRRFKLTRVRR